MLEKLAEGRPSADSLLPLCCYTPLSCLSKYPGTTNVGVVSALRVNHLVCRVDMITS